MRDTVVLCYHAVSEDWPAPLSVRPDRLEEQLELLLRRGYRGATFSEAVLAPPWRRTVAVTFDDGFRSVRDLALPILSRLGLPGTIFAVSAFAAGGGRLSWDGIDHWESGPHSHELESLSWDDLRGMSELGWEVGSHTRSHPRLTRLDDASLKDELRGSLEACRDGRQGGCSSVAYPYGDVDARVVAVAGSAGYRTGAALPARPHARRPLEWPRIGVYHGDDRRRFVLKLSRLVRAGRRLARR